MILSLGIFFFSVFGLVLAAGGGGGGGGGGATFSTTETSFSSLGGGRVENHRAKPRSATWSRTETTAPDPKRDLGVTPRPSTESNIRLLSPVAGSPCNAGVRLGPEVSPEAGTARLHQNGGVVQAVLLRNSRNRPDREGNAATRPLDLVSTGVMQTSIDRSDMGRGACRAAFPLSGHIGGVSVSQRQKDVWRNARAALVGIGLLCGSAALAQGTATSVLTGNVVDAATRAPVADVVVTATSPGLQGEQVVVTDGTGLYRIPQLPPGSYTLRFEKESYRPYSRTGIDVAADRTLRLNVELLPETAGSETVTVVGTPPTIDVGSTQTGTSINQSFVQNLALARAGGLGGSTRSFEAIALTAPQANQDLYGVGLNGATSPENVYLIDGLSVNDPAYGVNGSPLSVEFLDEVNVITGGYMPEYGRTSGGAISAVTKSGGNEFHGSIFGTWTPGSLQGSPATVTALGSAIAGTREL